MDSQNVEVEIMTHARNAYGLSAPGDIVSSHKREKSKTGTRRQTREGVVIGLTRSL